MHDYEVNCLISRFIVVVLTAAKFYLAKNACVKA